MTDQGQNDGKQDWQKTEARVLGQILAAQNILFVLPDTTRIAGFFAQALVSVPGVTSCRVCLGDVSVQVGLDSDVCRACEVLRQEASETLAMPFGFKCGLADQHDIRIIIITLETSEHTCGFFVFRTDTTGVFESYRPFVNNLANYIALSLENRLQKSFLQEARDELERKVEERTDKLTAANKQLYQEINERKKAEENLLQQSRTLDSFFKYTITPLAILDRYFNFIRVNEAYAASCQRDVSEFPGHNHFEFYPSDARIIFEQVVDTKEPYQTFARPFTYPDHPEWGVTYWDWILTPILSDTGEVEFLMFSLKDVTERKKAEEALIASEARYRGLFDDSPISLWEEDFSSVKQHIDDLRASGVSDFRAYFEEHPEEVAHCVRATKIIDTNQQTLKLFRADSKEQLIEGLHVIFSKESFDIFKEELITFAGGDTLFQSEAVLKNLADDKLCTVVRLSIAPGYENTWGKVFVSVSDITERKGAEHSLAENEARLRTLVQTIPDLIWLKDAEGIYLACNTMFEHLFGAKEADIIGKTDYDFVDRDLADFFRDQDHKAMAVGKPRSNEEWITFADDGHRALLDILKTPMFDVEGKLIGILGIARDITERKQTEDELRFRNLLLSTQQEVSIDGILVVDENGKMISSNHRFVEMWEISSEVIESKSDERALQSVLDKLVEPEQFLHKVQYLYEHRHEKSLEEIELKDGRTFDRYSAPMFGTGDKYYGRVWYFRDITEHKKLEAQLRHAQKMEAIGTLAGSIAHDFNNILNVIMGYGSMVMDRIGNDQLAKEQMNEVLAAADRAANLTKRLLIFSRKQVVEVKPVNVNEIILGLEKMLSRLIGEDIAFVMELTSRKMIVMADTGQIEQVLMNLISNARYAMSKGGKLAISTGIKEMDESYITAYGYGKAVTYALISVSDTGSGMDAETQRKIFEPFFTTKAIGEGTGLGLSIVYGIIKQHEGYINVYSEPGKGTEFKIYLPLIEEETAKGIEVEAVAPIKGGTETILLAEDDASLKKLSRIVLESLGYTVITAEDGEEAIIKYKENREKIQLVVLDMIMPKKNGKEAYAEIKKIRPNVKALFVSGYTIDIIHKKELLDEGLDLILKPVSPKDLVRKVREILDR